MAAGAFEIETQPAGEGVARVELRGTLGARQAGELRRALGEAMRGAQRVRVDLEHLDFLDGGSAAVLADTWCARREAGVEIEFVGARESVGTVLALYTERAPRHCTLYGDASFIVRPWSIASSSRSRCSSAASRSIPNVHSYG